jgi:hypothetical protein
MNSPRFIRESVSNDEARARERLASDFNAFGDELDPADETRSVAAGM